MNPLNDFKDFHDPETASSSKLTHVPSHLLIVPSIFGKCCCDSSSQSDTRNLCGMSRNVFVDPSAPDDSTVSSLRNVYVRSRLHYIWRTRSIKHMETSSENWWNKLKTLQALQFLPRDLPGTCRLGMLLLSWKRLTHKITWINSRRIKSGKCVSINTLRPLPRHVGGWASKQKCVLLSDYVSEAMRWVKEVEMITAVNDLKTS